MSSPRYEVTILPIPIAESHVIKYKEIRLQSLLVDPAAFGSTYARENMFTQDIWRKRLDSVHVASIIVYSAQLSAGDENDEVAPGSEWVGIVTILAPSAMQTRPRKFILPEAAKVGEETQVYGLFGVWVHPDHRGRGLGIRLLDAGLEWVRRNDDPLNAAGSRDKVVALQADERNKGALGLYCKAGFKMLSGDSQSGEEPFMIMRV